MASFTSAEASNLFGPAPAQPSANQLIVGYSYVGGNGYSGPGKFVWQARGKHAWTKPKLAESKILSPTAFAQSIAVNTSRVATLADTGSSNKPTGVLTEQTMSGHKVFVHSIRDADVVALDPDNMAAAVGADTNYNTNTSLLEAWTVSPRGKVSKPVVLQRRSTGIESPLVVAVGRGTFLAAWNAQGTVRVAKYSHGAWSHATTLTPHDTTVTYLGLVAHGTQALLTFNNDTGTSDNGTLNAVRYSKGAWRAIQTVAKHTQAAADSWAQSIAANGTVEITERSVKGTIYTQTARGGAWQHQTNLPPFSSFCLRLQSTAYQGNTLHYFVGLPHGSGKSAVCQLDDYTLR